MTVAITCARTRVSATWRRSEFAARNQGAWLARTTWPAQMLAAAVQGAPAWIRKLQMPGRPPR